MRKIPNDVKDLLTDTTDDGITKPRRVSKIISALLGAVIGAVVGFVLMLFVFGLLGGGAQAGIAAISLGSFRGYG